MNRETFINRGEGVSFVVDDLVENALEHDDEPQVCVTVRFPEHEGPEES